MDPAALQLVLGVVLFAAIQGYAQAQGKADAESSNAKGVDQGSADRDALHSINEALRDGHISDAERDGLKRLQNQFRLTDEEVQVMVDRVKADKKAAQE